MAALLARPLLAGRTKLVLDRTGVGVAVADLFRASAVRGPAAWTEGMPTEVVPSVPHPIRAPLYEVTIHGGDRVAHEWRHHYRVPKRDLVVGANVALQARRLRIAPELPHAATLVRELEAFRYTLSPAGRDSYGVAAEWREGAHDDLLLAVAVALWVAQHVRPSLGGNARIAEGMGTIPGRRAPING